MKKLMTGHMHRGSAYESDDSCGNCDGANCDSCKVVFVVGSEWFPTAELAKAAEEVRESILPAMYRKPYEVIEEQFCFIGADNNLYAEIWHDGEHIDVQLIPGSERYDDLYIYTLERKERYDRCKVADKDVRYVHNHCKKHGCQGWGCTVASGQKCW